MAVWPSDTEANHLTVITMAPGSRPVPARYGVPRLPDHLQGAEQNNPALIQHIRDYWIIPPNWQPQILDEPLREDFSQREQSPFLDKLFNQKRGGFYIEAGALDGEKCSNSLFFERRRDWSGLLIEPDPDQFERLLKKKRHAYSINCCISPNSRAQLLNFTTSGSTGGLTDLSKFRFSSKYIQKMVIQVQCFPLYSILAAIGNPYIDLASLDIEGAEIPVLMTIPFDKVNIGTFMVEVKIGADKEGTDKNREMVHLLLTQHGYQHIVTPFTIDYVMTKIW